MLSNLEERAISLLASGLPASKVAEALGVTPARISQLGDSPEFKSTLAEKKFSAISKHNEADTKLDDLEAKVLGKLSDQVDLGMLMKPLELTRIFQVLNAAKRRGTDTLQGNPFEDGNVVQLTMPVKVTNNFVTNINNQVIKAGGEDLITMQPKALEDLLNESLRLPNIESSNLRPQETIQAPATKPLEVRAKPFPGLARSESAADSA